MDITFGGFKTKKMTINMPFPNKYYCYFYDVLGIVTRELLSRTVCEISLNKIDVIRIHRVPLKFNTFTLDSDVNVSCIDVNPSVKHCRKQ